jgi:hypothetical protein
VDTSEDFLTFQKSDSSRKVKIPSSFIESTHIFGDARPALVQLSGRLQWISKRDDFVLFCDKPPAGSDGAFGIAKDANLPFAESLGVRGQFAGENWLPQLLAEGWQVYYDEDGTYLRMRDTHGYLVFATRS